MPRYSPIVFCLNETPGENTNVMDAPSREPGSTYSSPSGSSLVDSSVVECSIASVSASSPTDGGSQRVLDKTADIDQNSNSLAPPVPSGRVLDGLNPLMKTPSKEDRHSQRDDSVDPSSLHVTKVPNCTLQPVAPALEMSPRTNHRKLQATNDGKISSSACPDVAERLKEAFAGHEVAVDAEANDVASNAMSQVELAELMHLLDETNKHAQAVADSRSSPDGLHPILPSVESISSQTLQTGGPNSSALRSDSQDFIGQQSPQIQTACAQMEASSHHLAKEGPSGVPQAIAANTAKVAHVEPAGERKEGQRAEQPQGNPPPASSKMRKSKLNGHSKNRSPSALSSPTRTPSRRVRSPVVRLPPTSEPCSAQTS